MLKRLKDDFQLSMLCLIGLLACVGIGPYVIYRLLMGNAWVALIDALMVIGALVCVGFAWRTGATRHASLLVTLIVSVGAVTVVLDIGMDGLYWIYALILVNFLMTGPWLALLIISSVVLIITSVGSSRGTLFEDVHQMSSFVITSSLCCLFSFLFAQRTRYQNAKLKLMIDLDPLTGASNRRSLTKELKIAQALFTRQGTVYGLLAIDLDHFKQVNDNYGHAAGDAVLIDFVKVIKSRLRSADRVFRLGGEEFLVLLPEMDAYRLKSIAQQLQRYIAEHLKSPGGAITVSIGGALVEPFETPDQWLKRADNMLYKAKHAGRNCTLIDQYAPRQEAATC